MDFFFSELFLIVTWKNVISIYGKFFTNKINRILTLSVFILWQKIAAQECHPDFYLYSTIQSNTFCCYVFIGQLHRMARSLWTPDHPTHMSLLDIPFQNPDVFVHVSSPYDFGGCLEIFVHLALMSSDIHVI